MNRFLTKAVSILNAKITKDFPFISKVNDTKKICFEEALDALSILQFGDIGLHRNSGYFSNIISPSFMKHSWIHVTSGENPPMIVEAINSGIVLRSALYPIFSDYVMILEPKNISELERKGACKKARNIVGENYDVNFSFDIEREFKYYKGQDFEEAKISLSDGETKLKKYDPIFSCTEVCSYAWWHQREALRLNKGKQVLLPDLFLNNSWKIKWMSQSITVDLAAKHKLSEEALSMIEDF